MALETFDYTNGTTTIPGATVWMGSFVVQDGALTTTEVNTNRIVWASEADGTWVGDFDRTAESYALVGVIFRGVDSNNFWLVHKNQDGRLRVFKTVGGNQTTEFDQTFSNALADNTISVTASGDDISVSLDGSEVFITTDSTHNSGTFAGLQIGSENYRALSFSYTGSVGVNSSILKIRNDNYLPVSGSVQVYVHKVSDKSVMFEGVAGFSNGNADISLPLADFPVGTTVDWSMIDPVNEMASSARQDTE